MRVAARPRFAARLAAMDIGRQARRRVCIWIAGFLLLAQWLVAGYVCAVPVLAPAVQAVAAATTDCHGMLAEAGDAGNPSLCKAHCDADHLLPTQALADDLAVCGGFCSAGLAVLDLPASQSGQSDWPRSGEPPGWPPLYLIHQVLRL